MSEQFRYQVGERVHIKLDFPQRHVRTPAYIRGKTGVIAAQQGFFRNPEQLAYGQDGLPKVPLYSVSFRLSDVSGKARKGDRLSMDIFEHWLEPAQ